MQKILLVVLGLLTAVSGVWAQRNCGSMDYLEQQIETLPGRQQQLQELEKRTREYLHAVGEKAFANGIVTIPVVVHVVYNGATQNISDAQIASQIDVLNDDFRRLNADAGNTPGIFSGVAADTEIEFCLVQTIRKVAGRTSFGTNDSVKSNSTGGSDAVTPTQAMNMWVCNIGGGILGYAQFPGGPASTDGVVVDYRYFGTVGTATAPFDLGRTATHEVGHWLNLRHIWGDGSCSVDDFVSDTPNANGPNYTGSPCTFPGRNSCNSGSGDQPDMFQNYMDYSDDGCMNLFTTGQKSRMWAAINAARPGLLSAACSGTPPPAVELCNNGVDDDGDGFVDCADGDCATDPACAAPTTCAAPTNLTHTRRRNGREALLSWSAASGASNYRVEVYRGNGTLLAAGTISGTSATVSGLTKNAPYTWRVQTNCSNGSTSDWANGAFNARLAAFATSEPDITLTPNPTGSDRVDLSWDLPLTDRPDVAALIESAASAESVTIRVYDLAGRTLLQRTIAAGNTSLQLDISGLAPGVYVVRAMNTAGFTASTKLVKL